MFRLRTARTARFLIMPRKRFLSVSNFDTLQHYKDRSPIWIKLHCAILDDYAFSALPDETKFHAIGLMMLASRLNNKFPYDERWLRLKIGANSEINLKILLEIRFLEFFCVDKPDAKNTVIARKSNKTQGESASATFNDLQNCASATFNDAENCASPEQNRSDEKRTEENTPQQTQGATPDAKNVVVVGDFKSFSEPNTEAENQSEIRSASVYQKEGAAVSGHRSRFTLEECLKYARQSDGVKNPHALATNLFQTGNADAFIMAMLYPVEALAAERESFGEPTEFTNEPCSVCFGAKLADTDGKGYRKCSHCKDERGKSSGFEPRKTELKLEIKNAKT